MGDGMSHDRTSVGLLCYSMESLRFGDFPSAARGYQWPLPSMSRHEVVDGRLR